MNQRGVSAAGLASALAGLLLAACGGGGDAASAAGSAASSGGAASSSSAASVSVTDNLAPSTPQGLRGSANAGGVVTLSWTASTDQGGSGLSGYRVFRGGSLLATAATTSYADSSAAGGTTYSYSVRAYDGAGNESAGSAAVSVTTPVVATTLTLGAHPRLWIDAARMANLRAHVNANSAQWRLVKARADQQLARGTAFTADSDEFALGDLGLACLLTTDTRYAARAAAILQQYAVSTNTLQGDSGYNYRLLYLAVMGLDWCYAGLPDAVRKQTATWLMDRADWVWPETNTTRVGAWGVAAPSNNYFWGFMYTSAAALAAYGDDTGSGAVSGSNRPAYHVSLGRGKWRTLAVSYLGSWAAGGVYAEGTNYEATRPMALFADAFHTALADDSYAGEAFFRALYQWQLHQTAPRNQYFVYMGEQARDSVGGIIYYERTHHLLLSAFTGVATAAEKAASYRMVSDWPIYQSSSLGLTALDMLYWDQGVTPAADLSALPRSFIDPATGVVVYRTSRTDPDATLVFFESGPIYESHQLFNANGLMIWKGGYWVLGHGQMWDRDYDLGQSSIVYTSGGAQNWQSSTTVGGSLVAADAGGDYLYVAGQARDAYGRAGSRPLSDALRKLVYVAPLDAFVVLDRVAKTSATDLLTWKWWARPQSGAPQVNGNLFSFSNNDGSATLFGQNLGGAGALSSQATPGGAYFVQRQLTTGAGTSYSATALRLNAGISATLTETTERAGVQIANCYVSLGKNESAAASVGFSTDATSFVVSDLVPSVDYRASDTASTVTVRTSGAGVARFTLPAGGARTVTLARP